MTGAATALAIVLKGEQLDEACQLFDEAQAEQFAKLAVQVQDVVAKIPAAKIASEEQAHEVNALLGVAERYEKAVEAARKDITAPLNAQVKAVNDLFRPLTVALSGITAEGNKGGRVRPLVLAWIKAKQEAQKRAQEEADRVRREAEQREIAARIAAEEAATEAARKEQIVLATEAMQDAALAQVMAPVPVRGIASASASHTITKHWVVSAINPAELPREYLMPNEPAIKDALASAVRRMRAEGKSVPDFEVLGVTIEETEGLRKGRGIY